MKIYIGKSAFEFTACNISAIYHFVLTHMYTTVTSLQDLWASDHQFFSSAQTLKILLCPVVSTHSSPVMPKVFPGHDFPIASSLPVHLHWGSMDSTPQNSSCDIVTLVATQISPSPQTGLHTWVLGYRTSAGCQLEIQDQICKDSKFKIQTSLIP